jgi:hypothetical protein
LAQDFWNAHLLLTRGSADDRAWAIDEAVRLLAENQQLARYDDFDCDVRAARTGDVVALEALAIWLDIIRQQLDRAAEKKLSNSAKPRGKRKPTLAQALRQAANARLPVKGAVIGSDGIELHFGEPEPTDASNPWLADLEVTKQ